MSMIVYFLFLFFFKQKTAYEMRISDWSSDVCSSDLPARVRGERRPPPRRAAATCRPGSSHGSADRRPAPWCEPTPRPLPRRRRPIPVLSWGHLLRFDPAEIESWLNAGRVSVEGSPVSALGPRPRVVEPQAHQGRSGHP